MDISCAFPPVPDTADHIALAERLGYRRAWVYDTPELQLDVWATLARAADRTRRIELGPGVLIPSLRHVLVTAAAIATLVTLAPGRVNVGIGSGFTGRLAMGRRPNSWTFVTQYIRQLKALLAGEVVDVDGAATQLLVFALRKDDPTYRCLGARGSVFGIVMAAVVLRPDTSVMLFFVPVPIPGPVFMLGYAIISIVLIARKHRGRISHEGHLGGPSSGSP